MNIQFISLYLLNLLNFANEDLLISIISLVLLISLLRIIKLKKTLSQEASFRLHPQLFLKIIENEETEIQGVYLKNESYFLVTDIKIDNAEVEITDYGFKKKLILQFEPIAFLKPKEKIKLKFKVFDKNQTPLYDIIEKIIPHLLNVNFRARLHYTTIEGRTFSMVLFKKKQNSYIESVKENKSH